MALVMIQGEHAVVPALECQMKYRVRPDGAFHVVSFLPELLDRRVYLFRFFSAEQPVFSAVGIQSGNGHGSLCHPQPTKRFCAAVYIVHNPVFGYQVTGLAQGNMPRQEEHPHPPHLKHGQGILCTCQSPEDLGMTNIGNAAFSQGFLVDRCCSNCVHQPCVREADALSDILIGSLSAHPVNRPDLQFIQVDVVQVDQVQDSRLIPSLLRFPDHVDPGFGGARIGFRQFHHAFISHHNTAGNPADLRIRNGFQHNFRSDAGSVSHGDTDKRSVHVSVPRLLLPECFVSYCALIKSAMSLITRLSTFSVRL